MKVYQLPAETAAALIKSDLGCRVLSVELTGFEGEPRWDASKPDGQPRRMLDTSRARERFGFEAKVGLDEGLMRTIAWYRTQPQS